MSVREVEQLTLGFIEQLENCASTQEIEELFATFTKTLGFSMATCIRVPDAGEELASCFLLNTYPNRWVARYIERDFIAHDPLVSEVFRTYKPFRWSEVVGRLELSREQRDLFHEAAELGMREGLVVPIYEASGYTGLVSIAGEETIIALEVRKALTLACVYLHNKLNAVRRQVDPLRASLTSRELDCLQWAAAGKSDWEIGQILSISAKTVNYHIENAKRKFGVTTRVQAIVAALRHGSLSR